MRLFTLGVIFLNLCSYANVWAQTTGSLTGHVLDAHTHRPISYAMLTLKGSTRGGQC